MHTNNPDPNNLLRPWGVNPYPVGYWSVTACIVGVLQLSQIQTPIQPVVSEILNSRAKNTMLKYSKVTSLKQKGSASTATPMMLFARLKTNGQLDDK